MINSPCALLLFLASATFVHATEFSARVVDENGVAVEMFEVLWHTADHGCSQWSRKRNGLWKDQILTADRGIDLGVIDLIVRAEGFASCVQRFEGESLQSLRDGNATIVLDRGTQVTIESQHLTSPIPNDFVMESYFPQFAWRVRMMWQPVNLRGQKKPDWNMLNVQRIDDSRFSVRVSKNTGEFFLAFQHPGWLQFCEFGPFSAEEVAAKGLKLQMPKPAKIEVTFDPRQVDADRPFQSTKCSIFWVPDDSGAIYFVTDGVPIDESKTVAIADLGPGKYNVEVRTIPKDEVKSSNTREINSGKFYDRETCVLRSGEVASVAFSWVPFDPNAYRGTADAEITVLNGDGTVPSGREIVVSWFDGHYGSLEVFQGPLPDSGKVRLNGISAVRHRSPAPFGPYSISIDGERLGFFKLSDSRQLQQVQFTVSPKEGDVAPDIELIAVDSEQHQRLSDFRGKVVLLEFWSTWCGPCQPAMQKLSELAGKMPAAWIDKVVLLSLSTDHAIEKVRTHVASRGWNGLPHFQSARKDGEYFSEAEKSYVVHAIPHAILIDQVGRVRWRGHPTAPFEGKTVNDRINELVK